MVAAAVSRVAESSALAIISKRAVWKATTSVAERAKAPRIAVEYFIMYKSNSFLYRGMRQTGMKTSESKVRDRREYK